MAFNLEFGQNLGGKSAQVKSGVPGGSTQDGGSHARTEWSVVKRKRRSTGGSYADIYDNSNMKNTKCVSKNEFVKMDTDQKLNALYDMIANSSGLTQRLQAVETKLDNIEVEHDKTKYYLKTLQYKSIDQEARSRRNNLIFRGIQELYLNENCEDTLADFLEQYLDIDTTNICVEDCHRIGAPRGKTRPIICTFSRRKDVEYILSKANLLKNTNYGINRDYPQEIVAARTKIWPEYKKQRSIHSKKGQVFIGYPAKLIVNRKVVQDEFPDWKETIQRPRTINNEHMTNNITKQSEYPHIQVSSNSKQTAINIESDTVVEMQSENSDRSDSESTSSTNDAYSQEMQKMQHRLSRKNTNAPLNLSNKFAMLYEEGESSTDERTSKKPPADDSSGHGKTTGKTHTTRTAKSNVNVSC